MKKLLIVLSFVALIFFVPPLISAVFSPTIPSSLLKATSRHFEVKNSQYLNLILDSDVEITAEIQSIPNLLRINFSANSQNPQSQITLSGLQPNTIYHLYLDGYINHQVFTTDQSGVYRYTQDLSSNHLVFIQTNPSTKFIRADSTGGDCISIGSWDLATLTCTLTTDLGESIQVDSDGITLDGNQHTLTGSQTGSGIHVFQRSNTTIKNLIIKNFTYGIFVYLSSNFIISDNTLENNTIGILLNETSRSQILSNKTISNSLTGIYLTLATDNQISDNTATNNGNDNSNEVSGIFVNQSPQTTLRRNNMSSNRINFGLLDYNTANLMSQDIDTSNLADGKPIIYLKSASNQTIDGSSNAATIYCINCQNISIKNINLSQNYIGVFLHNTQDSSIDNITSSNYLTGIMLQDSGNILITNSTLNRNLYGLITYSIPGTSPFTLIGNHLEFNQYYGLITYTPNSLIANNYFNQNSNASMVILGQNVTVRHNTIKNHLHGIESYNTTGLAVFNNNFYGNSFPALFDQTSGFIFNKPLPDGGNYWDSYVGVDTNNDGFYDTPYAVTPDYSDNLPYVKSDNWFPSTTIGFSGSQAVGNTFTSDVSVTLSATGNIAKTEYSFDNTNWLVYTTPVILNQAGNYTIFYRSFSLYDNFIEATKQATITIIKTNSTISILFPTDRNHTFRRGTNIPVSFVLKDNQGSFVAKATAKIYLISSIGQKIPGFPANNFNSGNTFVHIIRDKLYLYNLSTKNLTKGTWSILIEVDNGPSKQISIDLI